jgi:hypothetical protein
MIIKIHFKKPILFLLVIYSIILNPYLEAQNEDSNSSTKKDTLYLRTHKQLPILNDFRFIPTDVIIDPFINTYIKLSAGTGTALDLQSYVKNLQGEIFDTLSGDLAYVSGGLEFQYAVNDWLAFSAGYGGSSRLGSNAYTLLTSGISYTTGFTFGGKIRIWQNEKMLLSGSIDYASQEVALYSIYDFVKDVYEAGGDIDSAKNSLLQKDNVYVIFINANYAFAPTNWCGFTAIAGWGVTKSFQSKDKGNLRIGATYSIDFENVEFIEFPVGILFSTRYNSYAESGSNVSEIFEYGFKIAYTGHKDFDIGIESTYQTVNYSLSDEPVKTILTKFNLRYYF